MSIERLLAPVSWEGIILQLQKVPSGGFAVRRWDLHTHSWVDSEVSVGKLMSLSEATPAELAAANLSAGGKLPP